MSDPVSAGKCFRGPEEVAIVCFFNYRSCKGLATMFAKRNHPDLQSIPEKKVGHSELQKT
jgi:hypothetical protein